MAITEEQRRIATRGLAIGDAYVMHAERAVVGGSNIAIELYSPRYMGQPDPAWATASLFVVIPIISAPAVGRPEKDLIFDREAFMASDPALVPVAEYSDTFRIESQDADRPIESDTFPDWRDRFESGLQRRGIDAASIDFWLRSTDALRSLCDRGVSPQAAAQNVRSYGALERPASDPEREGGA